MIRVKKPALVPKHLATKGKAENDKNCRAYNFNPTLFLKKIEIKATIYNHDSIKKILKLAQFSKCCFCEKNQTDEDGAVEHYRPKLGYKSSLKEKLQKPGYFWHGYKWENLYFICTACNRFKGNLFPLKDESKRAKTHKMDFRKEWPLILDPGGQENPRNHIVFIDEFPKGKSREGRKTIEVCHLNRDGLNELRRKHIKYIESHIATIYCKDRMDRKSVDRAKKSLKECQRPDAEFSSTAIDFLKQFRIVINS